MKTRWDWEWVLLEGAILRQAARAKQWAEVAEIERKLCPSRPTRRAIGLPIIAASGMQGKKNRKMKAQGAGVISGADLLDSDRQLRA